MALQDIFERPAGTPYTSKYTCHNCKNIDTREAAHGTPYCRKCKRVHCHPYRHTIIHVTNSAQLAYVLLLPIRRVFPAFPLFPLFPP